MRKTMQGAIRRNLGYTIDQTILIVAVIAVLITLIIASVGWDLLSRAGGAKLASYFKQIEDANAQFYAKMGVWPHDAMNQAGIAARQNPAGYILVLKDRDATFTATGSGQRFFDRFQDYLPGFSVDNATTPTTVEHSFGNGGDITQAVGGSTVCPGNSDYLRVTMTGVTIQEIIEADSNIDNDDDSAAAQAGTAGTNGRLRWTTPANGVADVSFCANNVGF